ncbi:hypothetical protein [Actinoalloteichus hymeniacidonis]|uniref:Uncharacterized protein n=1 Tax=Actinoalloteichus hymeniacidonis TaxID=340345 RepID=A0AAC9HUR7_9PSEU|nr:hypothetical protein [Actinoalloteichus hymeniacidonis]AOS65724.1 hypothetical protein TL08_24730 [Actinoalloteichus hymeniacidonis]MBB5906186.1 membrane protease YdiL (CAAX protease family) [Actinoalloteichus hymeniacidonis]
MSRGAERRDRKRASLRGPRDLLTLVSGVIALLVAGYVLANSIGWVPLYQARWLLAAGAVIIGLVLLLGSLRSRREE